ncbi:MAG: ERAP1-like C-terminal domain-containing protein, partial [Candidatus Saccharimonadales bacterium]
GLRIYLKKHQYGNTNTVDLWSALEEVSGTEIKDFMHSWTSQTGFPLVAVKVEENTAELKQQRFLLNPKAELKASETWPVPLLTTASDRGLFANSSKKFKLKDADNFKLNLGQSGLYRASYNASHLQKIAKQINKLEPVDRLGLISDAFETSKSGLASIVSALELIANYENEDSPIVWDIISGNLSAIRRVMDDEKLNDALRPFARELTKKQLARLGWQKIKNEDHFDSLLRPTILGLSAWADEPATVKKALELFNKAGRPEDIEPDLRGVVYGTAARLGSKKEFDKMLAQHNTSNSSEARLALTAALTGFKQADLVKKALAQVTSDNVRLQDAAYWVAYSLGNRHGKKLAWQWIKDNWDWLAKNLGDDLSFYRFPVYAARSFATSDFLKDYEKFFTDKKTPALERPINQGIETIQWQTAWRTRDHAAIKKYFKA